MIKRFVRDAQDARQDFLLRLCHAHTLSLSHSFLSLLSKIEISRSNNRATNTRSPSLSLSLCPLFASLSSVSLFFFLFVFFFLFFFLCFRSLYDRSQDVTNFLIDSACTFVQLTVTQSLLNDRIGEKKGKVMERLASLYRTLNFPVDLRNRLQRKQSKRRIPVIINSVN